MKRQKRTRRAWKTSYNIVQRTAALVLAVWMLVVNLGTDLHTSYAAAGTGVDFEIYGSDLVDAINRAIESGDVITEDSFDFTHGDIASVEELFFDSGKVYEIYPEIEGGDRDADLRVFARLPEDADDMYMVTGDEELLFMYINNGSDTLSCSTRVIRTVDGDEKVKSTKRVAVKSFERLFGGEEVEIISKPAETTAEETKESETAETPIDETVVESGTDAGMTEESGNVTTEIGEEKPEEEAGEADGQEAEQAEGAEETEKIEKEEAEETEKIEKEEADEADSEAGEQEDLAEADTVAAISRYMAPVVAVPEGENADETEKAVSEDDSEEESEKEEADEAEDTSEDDSEEEPEKEEADASEQNAAENESPVQEPTSESDESKATTESDSQKETAETESGAQTESTAAATASNAETTAAETTAAEEKPVKAANAEDVVGLGYCSTAKVYTTTLKALKALEDISGYEITYTIEPESTARIVDGPRGVEEGESLSFGVKNQIGFAVEHVFANGEELESTETKTNEDGSSTVWYFMEYVTEEQEIEVYMTETGAHPAVKLDPIEVDGVVISISAEEGVLPDGVSATALRLNEDVEAAVAEKMTETGEGTASAVMAFDISLWLGDELLDSSIWGGSRKVNVSFSGAPIQEMSAEADNIQVLYVETEQDSNKDAKASVALGDETVKAEDVVGITTVGEAVKVEGDASVDEISFEAEHFTTYACACARDAVRGETVKLRYKPNDGSGRQSEMFSVHVGDTITISDESARTFSNAPVNGYHGKIITGWHYIKADGTNSEIYRTGDSFVVPGRDEAKYEGSGSDSYVQLWAEWEPGVILLANDGSGRVLGMIKKGKDGSIVIPEDAGKDVIHNNGSQNAEIVGWSHKSNAAGDEIKPNGATVSQFDSTNNGRTVLWAIWRNTGKVKVTVDKVIVSAIYNDGRSDQWKEVLHDVTGDEVTKEILFTQKDFACNLPEDKHNGFVVFLLKPYDDHLLTNLYALNETGGDKLGDRYLLNEIKTKLSETKLHAYPKSLSDQMDHYLDRNYVAAFGFSRWKNTSNTEILLNTYADITAVPANVGVTIKLNNGTDAAGQPVRFKKDDIIEWDVTVSRDVIPGSKVIDVADEIRVNGKAVGDQDYKKLGEEEKEGKHYTYYKVYYKVTAADIPKGTGYQEPRIVIDAATKCNYGYGIDTTTGKRIVTQSVPIAANQSFALVASEMKPVDPDFQPEYTPVDPDEEQTGEDNNGVGDNVTNDNGDNGNNTTPGGGDNNDNNTTPSPEGSTAAPENHTPGGDSGSDGSGSTGGGSGSTTGQGAADQTPSGGPGASSDAEDRGSASSEEAVNIEEEGIPLAAIPDTPGSLDGFFLIDDGEIPLSALPKTGGSHHKMNLTMMISGILLMMTALHKKHKEED